MQIIYFQFKEFHVYFMILQSIGFKFFGKIMKGSCVLCCSSCINFNPTSHLNKNVSFLHLLSATSTIPKPKTNFKMNDGPSNIFIYNFFFIFIHLHIKRFSFVNSCMTNLAEQIEFFRDQKL